MPVLDQIAHPRDLGTPSDVEHPQPPPEHIGLAAEHLADDGVPDPRPGCAHVLPPCRQLVVEHVRHDVSLDHAAARTRVGT